MLSSCLNFGSLEDWLRAAQEESDVVEVLNLTRRRCLCLSLIVVNFGSLEDRLRVAEEESDVVVLSSMRR